MIWTDNKDNKGKGCDVKSQCTMGEGRVMRSIVIARVRIWVRGRVSWVRVGVRFRVSQSQDGQDQRKGSG